MSLTGNAILYLQQTFPNASFLSDIILRDDGNGPYVYYWGVGSPQPTESEINDAAASLIPKLPKPTIEQQLQLIYNDMKNGTKTFVSTMDQYNK